MEKKNYYCEKLKGIIMYFIAGLILGVLLGIITKTDFLCTIVIAIMVSGVPYGWKLISRVADQWVFLNSYMFLYVGVKSIASFFIGAIALPVSFIYYLIRFLICKKGCNQISDDSDVVLE